MMQQSHDERRMNMNTQLPEKVNTFFENCKKNNVHPIPKDPHFNNLYLIQSVDMDGNVTDEKFGFNELTEQGLRNICWSGDFKAKIYSADESFAKLSNTSNSPHYDITFSPVYYDSNTSMSTQYYKFRTVMEYNYNYDGVTSDVEITKLGLYVGNNSGGYTEYAKSLIYDVNGNVTSFIKHPNEKILLTVWLGASMDVGSIVNAAWNNGNYLLISPHFILRYAAGCTQDSGTSKSLNMRFGMRTYRYSSLSDADCWKYLRPFQSSTNPQCTREFDSTYTYVECLMKYANSESVSTDSVVYERNWASKYIISDYWSNSSFEFMVDADGGFALPNPEEITVDECMTNNNDPTFTDTLYAYPSSNSEPIGSWYYHSRLQLAQFNCTSIEVYNHKTKTWDQEAFDQDRNFLYEDTMLAPIWWPVIVNGTVVDRYVFVNSKAGKYPMTKLTTNSLHVWATDTYWDQSTWVEVDKNNLGSLGSKRYFIKPDYDDSPVPYYDYTPLQLTGLPTSYTIPKTFELECGSSDARKVLPDPNCNCIIGYGQIVYPDDPSNVVTYNITNYGGGAINGYEGYSYNTSNDDSNGTVSIFRLTENGDKLVVARRMHSVRDANDNYAAGCYRVYTISDDPTVAPTYEDIQVPYTNQLYNVQTYHSFTDQGFVVTNHNADKEVAIINLYGTNGVETEIIPGMWGYALNRTTNCVYLNTDDMSSLTFDVYDMSTKSVVKSFTLSGNYVMNGIMGWKNHVYVRVYDNTLQIYRVLYHDINEDSDTFIEVNIRLFDQTSAECTLNREPGGIYDNSFSSCDEAFFIYKPASGYYDETDYKEFLLILDNDPTRCRDLMAEHGWDKGNYDNVQLASNGAFNRNPDGSFVGLEVVEYNNRNSTPQSRYPFSSSVENCSNYMIDIGRLYDDNYFNKTQVCNYMWNFDNSGWGTNITTRNRNSYVIYKNYRVYQSGNNIKFVPLAYSRFHRISGNTISIQTINNPKRIAPQDEVRIRITR